MAGPVGSGRREHSSKPGARPGGDRGRMTPSDEHAEVSGVAGASADSTLRLEHGDVHVRQDRWPPSSAADYRAVPGARVDVLTGAGHTPILEEPLRTAALLLAFAALHTT